jgi:uncharacterized protein (TIGR03437 family)
MLVRPILAWFCVFWASAAWAVTNCSYTAIATPATGANPRALATADLNGDGIPDLVTANLDASSVSVLIGKGDGTFAAAVNYPAGSNPYQVILADFNGDGKPDIAAADFGGAEVSVLLGKGDGTFRAAITYVTGTKPRALVAADMNGDGYPDLAVANSTAMSTTVLPGKGDGTFQSKADTASGGTPHGIVAADFNADGKLDLAVANNTPSGTVTILLGNGAGAFTSSRTYSVGASPYGIAAGDFNKDGTPDLVTANFGAASLSVLLGKGDGTFQSAATYSLPGDPVAVRVSDINGDGVLDLLGADFGANSLDLLLGNGDGIFGAVTQIASLTGSYDVAVADFDQDGIPDLAVATSGLSEVTILKGACPSSAFLPVISSGGVLNAASGAAGVSPGAWISIYGSHLASTTYMAGAADLVDGFLPTRLKGVSVQINGKPAFLSYISPGQINVQAPDDTVQGVVAVSVSTALGASAAVSATEQAILPGLFTASGYVIGVRVRDGAIINSVTGAKPGDTLELFATGLGPASPTPAAGLVFSGADPVTNSVSVTLGSTAAQVLWSGLIGAGLYQINVTLPASLADGDYATAISVGGVASSSSPPLKVRND